MNPREMKMLHDAIALAEAEVKTNKTKANDYDSILKMMCALDAIVVTKWYGYTHQREILVFNKKGTIAFNFYDDDLLNIVPSQKPFEEWAATEFVFENNTDNIVTIYR